MQAKHRLQVVYKGHYHQIPERQRLHTHFAQPARFRILSANRHTHPPRTNNLSTKQKDYDTVRTKNTESFKIDFFFDGKSLCSLFDVSFKIDFKMFLVSITFRFDLFNGKKSN